MNGSLAGSGPLLRLALRRDRVRLGAWVLGLASFPMASYTSYESLFPTSASRQVLEAGFGATPAFRLLLGPARSLAEPGGFTAWRSGLFSGVFVALMAIFTVVRHGRAEEESGRTELVASAAVGRRALLGTGLVVAVGTAALAGAGSALLLVAVGAPVAGSVAMGLALLATGAVFAGIAAVAAQIASFARTANGIATGILGLAYVLRAWGDSTPGASWLSWCSPLGWGQEVRPFTGERWWVPALGLGAGSVAVVVADRLLHHRDLGGGWLVGRAGPENAPPGLRGVMGLSWRLHRGALVGWVLADAVCGALFGSITASAADLLVDNPTAARLLAAAQGTPSEAFVASMVSMLAIVASAFGVQAVVRGQREESEGRVEPLLATAATRTGWLASHLVIAFGGSALLVLVGGVAVALGAGGAPGAPSVVSTLIAATQQIPAVWVVVAVGAVLLGVSPRRVFAAWSAVIVSLVVTFFGPLLDLPGPVLDVSPFAHLARAPAEAVRVVPLVVLTAVVVAALVVAGMGMSRRDVG